MKSERTHIFTHSMLGNKLVHWHLLFWLKTSKSLKTKNNKFSWLLLTTWLHSPPGVEQPPDWNISFKESFCQSGLSVTISCEDATQTADFVIWYLVTRPLASAFCPWKSWATYLPAGLPELDGRDHFPDPLYLFSMKMYFLSYTPALSWWCMYQHVAWQWNS